MEKNTKIILWGAGILSALGLGFLIYNKVSKKSPTTSVDKKPQVDNSSKVDDLKTKMKNIDVQLSTPEMSKKWGQDDYVQLQIQRKEYAKQLKKLGWKSITSQQKDGSFLQQFVKI
jgi:hypothetical protein